VRYGRHAGVEKNIGTGSFEHAGEDPPVAALDRHGAVGGHAYYCLQAVDLS